MIKDLIQLDTTEGEARKVISLGINGKISFYIMNIKTNTFVKLTMGQLSSIQSVHPQKIKIHLEEIKLILYKGLRNAAHSQYINYKDLWIKEKQFKTIIEETPKETTLTATENDLMPKITTSLNPDKGPNEVSDEVDYKKLIKESSTLQKILTISVEAIKKFPEWKKTKTKIKKTGNLMSWLKDEFTVNEREASLIAKVLSEKFHNDI